MLGHVTLQGVNNIFVIYMFHAITKALCIILQCCFVSVLDRQLYKINSYKRKAHVLVGWQI